MIRKMLLLTNILANTTLLVFMLCLGSQNLSNKYSLNLGLGTTEKYPSGFLIGVSISLGYLSGGLTTVLLSKSKNNEYS